MIIVFAILVLLISLVIGIPVPFSFFASSFFLVIFKGYDPGFLLPFGFSKMNSMTLLSIPLFIIAGSLMNKVEIADRIIDMVNIFIKNLKGGLGAVTVISCAIFGAISGSSSATLVSIGAIMAPKLQQKGYPPEIIASIIASSGVLGILIPPSILMILYASIGNQSVLACFLAAASPGIMLMILLCLVQMFLIRNNPNIKEGKNYVTQFSNLKEGAKILGKNTIVAFPALLMPIIILGGIYGGIMTPTEAAAVSASYALVVGTWIYKNLNKRKLCDALIEAGTTSGVVMVMSFFVIVLSRIYIQENVPDKILIFLLNISHNKGTLILIVNIFMIILGMLMDDVSSCLLATPLLLPIVVKLGVSPIHFAAILGVNLGMGNITPPTAPLLYLAARIVHADVGKMLKPTFYMILFAWIPTLLLTTYWPQFSLWLPNLLVGK